MAGKRRRYGAEFKAKVTLEALKGELTIAQLSAKHGATLEPWHMNHRWRAVARHHGVSAVGGPNC